MNLIGKKVTALLLAACLLLGLTACKSNGGSDANLLSGTIYVPTFAGISVNAEYIYSGCASGDSFYFVGQVRGEEHEETETWIDENGEEQTNTYTWYDYRTAIFRVPLEGGDAVELENFQMTELPEGAEGSVNIDGGLWVDAGGSLWVTENTWIYNFDLPEDFDEENDSRWNYYVDEEQTAILHKLDNTGAEIDRIDLTNLAEKAEMEYVYGTTLDSAGNIYATNGSDKLAVLDSGLNLLFTLEGENLWNTMVQLSDGSMGILNSYYDEERGAGGNRLLTIDLASQDWGPSYELSQYAYEIYPGGGDYLFYYRNNTSIYGRKVGAEESEKVFSWMSSDIDPSSVSFFTFLADGRVAAMTRSWSDGDDGSYHYESAILTPTDASTLPQKKVLTYACMGLGYDMRNKILEFNKNSTDVRIEVSDYDEYNTGEDTSAGLTKLNTEVLAGHIPDILAAYSGMPIAQYGAKGLLEDLWPYIEGDEEIGGREGVMENVLKAAEQDGKLYRVFDSFDIRTVIGASRIVGERTSWTLADLRAALATMPDGCSVFGVSDTQESMLRLILACNMDSFVDWSTGECYFSSDSFKSLLEFCASFPAEFDWSNVDWGSWEDEDQRIISGKQMLQTAYIDTFTGIQRYQSVFGGDVSFVGYPMEDGSIGSTFQITGTGLAMSAACKDKDSAWSFIRQMLLPQAEEDSSSNAVMNARDLLSSSSMAIVSTVSGHYFYDFPVNRKDFETFMNDSLTVEYITDDKGEVVINEETGEPVMAAKDSYYVLTNSMTGEGEWKEIYAAQQKDVDQIMDLYNSITTVYNYDENIFNIVYENTGAYFAGDRTLEDTANLIQSAVKLYVGEQS